MCRDGLSRSTAIAKYQTVFQRYEKKYILNADKYDCLMKRIGNRLAGDAYGNYTIANLYYDTDRYDLARIAARKPVYREKLRLRSYGEAGSGRPVFIELKKKFQGLIYKRRVRLETGEAASFLAGDVVPSLDSPHGQILREIRQFLERYQGLDARMFLAYDRRAYSGTDDINLRITFDAGIRYRRDELRLDQESWGQEIMEPGKILMEIKTPSSIPLWLCRVLSDSEIFPLSFSKYGECCAGFFRR